ncbi:MAG: helix-turn-helix transcriptional regulator [Clostridia bacterium]|nr:helix-turn-helix transcriptional regulator [Clostridia bacterium]
MSVSKTTKFKLFCQKNGYSAEYLSYALGVSKRTIYSYMQGSRVPSRKICKRIDSILKVDSNQLFDF